MSKVLVSLDRQTADDAIEVIRLCLEEDSRRDFLNGFSVDVLADLADALGQALGQSHVEREG